MKKIFISLLVLLTLPTVYACSCAPNNHSDKDADNAVITFMQTQVGVDTKDLNAINSEYIGGYLSTIQRSLSWIIELLESESDAGYQCSIGCAKDMNSKYNYNLVYTVDEDTICTQDLVVTIEDNFTNK